MRKIIGREKQYEGTLSESRGASGGLATLWSNNAWQLKDSTTNQNWLKTELENIETKQRIIVYNVYSPNHYREKEVC